jgi:hypothetical protein
MPQFILPTGGKLNFPSNKDGYWEFSLKFSDRELEVDVNVENGGMTETLFEKVKGFIANANRFDIVARLAIRANFTENLDGASRLYLSHHADELNDEERAQYFGSRDANKLGVEQLLKSIHLMRIGLYPDSEDYVAVFDYTIDEDATDYVLAVQFDEAGAVQDISMDS